MSAKWRALQHRHRYTYSAVVFPTSLTESLAQIPSSQNSSFSKLHNEFRELVSLNSIYAQVNHAKKFASSFMELLSAANAADEWVLSKATRVYLEVMFLENSLPLHRTLISALAKERKFQALIVSCFRDLCDEYGGGGGGGGGGGRASDQSKRFCVSRVVLSVMSLPKLGYLMDVIQDCAVLVAWDVVLGLNGVVLETQEWARPSPIVMEQCQEALSCLYYLLQRCPDKFKGLSGQKESIMEMIFVVLISLLKSTAFSRDCYVAAGVALCAALQLCLGPQELGLFLIEGIFYQKTCNFSSEKSKSEFEDTLQVCFRKTPFNGDVCSEIHSFSVLSRLCLIRGILTAVSRNVLNALFFVSKEDLGNGSKNGDKSAKTILYNGILPELCSYCENPTDSHFNFHALTVLQICLQQIKTSILANLTNVSFDYDPIPEDMGTRILRIIWNNLEDPLSQTVKQVHLVFDLFLDIESSLRWDESSDRIKTFLQKIASDLLRLGPRCKGRYVPLALLTKRLGAKTLLGMSPDLLSEIVNAYIDDDVCSAATSFLKCFLECLRDECWSSNGISRGYAIYRGHCLPPFLYGLASGVSKLRSNLNTYALPVLLDMDVDSIFPMLAFVSVVPSEEENGLSCPELDCSSIELKVEQQVAVFVSLLKVSRSLALAEGDIDLWKNSSVLCTGSKLVAEGSNLYALVCIKGINFKVFVDWLVLALTHADESLRVDAAESLFLNPKTASLPSHFELTLMKEVVPLNMRSCSTAFQMKWTSLFRKFFSRVRTALERQFKQGSWRPVLSCENSDRTLINGTDTVISKAENLFKFMRWLSCFLFFSCYPSAPYKRKIMAMELILTMMNIWSIAPPQEKLDSVSPERSLYPYNKGITSPNSTLLLVGSIIDSWDRLRESSFRILLHFPSPLPGISSEDMVQNVITWSKKLVCSPRVRESDAGALALRLIFRKYVLGLGWIVRASVNVVCFHPQQQQLKGEGQICKSSAPVVEYIKSLIDWLEVAVKEGERDLSESCKNSFVHGILLALRYTFEELDWNSNAVLSGYSEMKCALEKLLELVMRITSLALWVVSADAWFLPEDMDDMVGDDNLLLDVPEEMDEPLHSLEDEEKNSKPAQDVRASEQVVMVGCWLAMKEVSLLLGTIIRKIPLPSNSSSDTVDSRSGTSDAADDLLMTTSDAMVDLKQLEKIGSHFLEVLLKMKHNGAIDKTRAGFTALCNRLLCSNDLRLCRLTESWMGQLMERTVAKGQIVDDLLRRSAGIPAAFIALFLAEPEGAPKKLLPQALRWLIDVANRSLLDLSENKGAKTTMCQFLHSNQETQSAVPPDIYATWNSSKIRDEGVVPTVHAFNILRAAFNDTNLAADTSAFSAEALIISIRSFSSPYWEIRNSACLAYTALIRRMIGFLNVQKRESARRALTGLEFFHRYPSLHPFIFNELRVITELLSNASSGQSASNLANVVHPSLCPMLIFLCRLKPSALAGESGDDLDPFLFMPFIRRCSTQSNFKVRVLASRALTGLVPNEKLPDVLLNIASELLCVDGQTKAAPVSSLHGTHRASFNLIHGVLLQLGSLLDANCRNLVDFSKKDQILGDLIKVLGNCSWIANPKRCPCPILNASFLKVLDHMLSIARACHTSKSFSTVRNLLLESSTDCLDVDASYGLTYYDPTIAELRKQAANSYFSCVFQASEESGEEVLQMPRRCSPVDSTLSKIPDMENAFSGLLERLVRSLSDSSYEVRLSTLKWLLKFLKSTESDREVCELSSYQIKSIQNWTKTNLQATLMSRLELEKNPRCTNYVLRLLFTWNLLQFWKLGSSVCTETIFVGSMDCDSVFQFWDRLMSSYELTRHTKIKESLINCMAICTRRFASLFTSSILVDVRKKTIETSESDHLGRSAHLFECITAFVNIINRHSSSSEPVNMRKAATGSIVASGLLEQADLIGSYVANRQIPSENSSLHFEPQEACNMYAHQVLVIWFTCIKLLEDEDDGIRQRLAIDVQKCFSLKRLGSSLHGVPNQVEKVIELSFEHLSSIFGCWIEYFDYLCQWVLIASTHVVSGGDLVRRVFDKEIDNHHEEKLFISQICCSQLEKIPILKSWVAHSLNKDRARNYLLGWRLRFSHQLMSFAKGCGRKYEGVDWIGGVGNHKDAFLPLYANLLGFYALSICIFKVETEDDMHLLSDVVELGRIISPFLRNPLICNLYLLVVKLHEKQTGATVDHAAEFGADMIWDGFDPYFLLR